MKTKIVAMAAALAGTLSPAAASTVAYTITGIVIDGGDHTSSGLFGGGSLKGQAFEALETIDTDHAQWSWANPGGSGANGGASTNGLSFINVALTIGSGRTSFSDYTSNVSIVGGSQFNSFVQSSSGLNKNDIGFYIMSNAIKADYTEPNRITGLADDYAGYYTLTDGAGTQVAWANFQVTGLSAGNAVTGPSTAISAVPLPGAAPLFGAAVAALAMTGYGIRRRAAVTASRSG